jgi:hypothetical protein
VGGTIDDVVLGVKVEAEGTMGADGILSASKVKFRPVVRIDANVESVDAAGATLSVLGFTVRVTPSSDTRGFTSLAELTGGAHVEVRGSPTRDGSAIDAMRIELVDTASSDRATLRGVVTEKTATSQLKLLGLAIDTRAASFRNHADARIDAAAFFDALVPNTTVVKVRWRPLPASTSAPVEEAELEND